MARGLPLAHAAGAILDAGVKILQLRHKAPYTREVFAQAAAIAGMCRQAGAGFVINDRSDIALILEAGVHLGQDDLPPAEVRRMIGPGRMLGFSTHNQQQVHDARAEPIDYVAFGPVYPTASKEKPDPVAGVEELRRAKSQTDRPLIAIGGITLTNSENVFDMGADSLAVISDLYPDPLSVGTLRARALAWLAVV